MNKTLISTLFATVAIPLAAFAQTDATQTDEPMPGTEQPADTTQDPAASTGDSDAGAAATSEDPASADSADDGSMATEDPAAADDAAMTDEEPAATDDSMSTAEEPMADDAATTEKLAGEDAVEGPFVTVPQTGAWRVSNLEGKNVEDANGESIGDITDVLVNERGEVIAVLVGVGGFLGIGQKDVAVAMSALEFGPGKTEGLKTEEEVQQEIDQQAQTQAPAGGAAGTAPATPAAAPQPTEPFVGSDNLPDRIVLNVTREELEAAPAYQDVEEGTTGAGDMPAEMPAEAPAEAPAEPAQ